jgi:hypothetical protein
LAIQLYGKTSTIIIAIDNAVAIHALGCSISSAKINFVLPVASSDYAQAILLLFCVLLGTADLKKKGIVDQNKQCCRFNN